MGSKEAMINSLFPLYPVSGLNVNFNRDWPVLASQGHTVAPGRRGLTRTLRVMPGCRVILASLSALEGSCLIQTHKILDLKKFPSFGPLAQGEHVSSV